MGSNYPEETFFLSNTMFMLQQELIDPRNSLNLYFKVF
ncbi:hypothetical protein MmTuc01_1398 [Methanosarcina mazei Tuc01]|uniref:Uncharacterized protein n=1 Tax=Methanosarcina mazei Tuc01 TaxID=1236903 RepID=M1Q3B9_METMZ|nr:hypothetical protein MmTuc01_1398 [Methanosarcina mazei Tuc01]